MVNRAEEATTATDPGLTENSTTSLLLSTWSKVDGPDAGATIEPTKDSTEDASNDDDGSYDYGQYFDNHTAMEPNNDDTSSSLGKLCFNVYFLLKTNR